MTRTVSLAIDAIAGGGDGVGRSDELVVFVPRTAPGDVVTASIAGRGHFARGMLRSVLKPSAERVDPPCPHYTRDNCGGCQVQHLAYPAQLAAKSRIVSDALRRIGKRDVGEVTVQPSENEWRYRSKLTLAMHMRGGRWIAGLHRYDDPSRIFALSDCPITDRRVVTVWREVLAASAALPDARSLRGSVRWTAQGATFTLTGGTRWTASDAFIAATPSLVAVYWQPDGAARRIVHDTRSSAEPAASFAQVNPAVAEALRAHVRAIVVARAPRTVTDAYSGSGTLARELAATGIAVTAIELDVESARWAERDLEPPSRSIAGRVEDVLPRLAAADLVVVNPPRAGMDAKVATALESQTSPAVVYVSCDPATLARDLTRLPSYTVESITSFDMFPQTAHVETVCVLTRSAS